MMPPPVALLALAVVAAAQAPVPPDDVNLHGKLYRAVFSSGSGALTSTDLAAVPDAVRERLSRCLARRAAFTSRYTHEASSFEEVRADAKRREVERAIVGLVETPGIESGALEFVRSARIVIDWKGDPDGPLGEAAAAEAFLRENPSSPLVPYLYLFVAHRQRAAFEAHGRTQNVEGMKAASRKYRTFLQRARSAADPIFALVADDLDRQPHVYLKTGEHPGTFDPDA